MTDLPGDNDQNKQSPQTPITAGVGKEKEGKQEVTPITEYTRQVDLEPEVEGWLEKVEKEDSQLQQAVTDDQTGQVILDSAKGGQGQQFKAILPLTKDEVEKGLHHKIIDSVRWLAEWCIRMVKMFGNRVAYRRSN